MNHAANRAPYPTRFHPLALLLLLGAVTGGVPATAPATELESEAETPAETGPATDQTLTPDPHVEALIGAGEQALEQRDLFAAAQAFTAAALASPDVVIAERATQFTFGTGFDALAEQSARRWAVLAPESPLPRELLGRLKLRRHAVDQAAADLLAALGPGEPRRDEVYLALASDLSAEDNARLVTRVLSRLTALDPLAPGMQLALGTAALRSGDYDLALGAGAAAGADDPEWPEPQLLMARALAALGRDDEALATAEAIARSSVAASTRSGSAEANVDRSNPLIDLEYARLLAEIGKVAEARQKLAALTVQYGDRPEINRTLAFLDLASGDLEAADQHLDGLDDAGPDRFESFYYRAQIAAQRGDAETARRFYDRISSGPYLVPAQLAMAESLARSNAAEEAVEQLTLFSKDHPAQAFDVLEFEAQLLQLLKRPDDALAVYGEALQYKPAAVSVLLARGALLEQQGRLTEALADLQNAVEVAPDDAAAANAFGYLLATRTSQTGRAWHYVRRAYEIEPGSAAIQDSVGWTLFKLHRPEEARSHLEEALDRLPDPEIASHLAAVLWKLGDRDAATDLLWSAAVAYPDSQPVRDTAKRLLD